MESDSNSTMGKNFYDDVCIDSGHTDRKLKIELEQMLSKRKTKHYGKHDSSSSDEIEIIEKQKHKHTNKHSKPKDSEDRLENVNMSFGKIVQVTKDTRSDVLRILLILQKLIDDSRTQKQKILKLEHKIKDLEHKLTNFNSSCAVHSSASVEEDLCREYEIKFDKFKQEVNTEIININTTIINLNLNFETQITNIRSQLVTMFAMPKHKSIGKCC